MKTPFTEKYILLKVLQKNPDAYAQAYDLYVDQIYRFVYFKIGSEEEAQDITAETFLKTWQYVLDGKKIENLKALLYRVARNLVIDHYRRQRQTVPADEELASLKGQEQLITNQFGEADDAVDTELLIMRMRDLKDEYREILLLRYIEGLSLKEIAGVLEKKPGAARVVLYRATKTLKSLIEQSKQDNAKKGSAKTTKDA